MADKIRIDCEHCGGAATCVGRYNGGPGPDVAACDDCCGHGNEDGYCYPLDDDLREELLDVK